MQERDRTRAGVGCAMALAAVAMACAAKPVLYPNAHLQRVGSEVAQYEIAECLRLARQEVPSDEGRDAAERTAKGGAVGGATGAAVGAVVGSAGRGAAAGAAGGATRGFMGWLFGPRPDALERSYTEACLRERGYQPIGWR
jgi:hypothetical protein